MRRRQTKVFLALGWHEPAHMLGINRYACANNWILHQSTPIDPRSLPLFQPHGIISQLAKCLPDLVKAVETAQVPTVELCNSIPGMRVPHVMLDQEGEGASWPMPLTVVAPNFEEQGYQAARLLDRMITGEKIQPDTLVKIPPIGLVPRDSTRCYAMDNLPIARATTFQKTTRRILDLIALNAQTTRRMLAEETGISAEGIKYHLRQMQRKGAIRRIGPDNGGHWEVVK